MWFDEAATSHGAARCSALNLHGEAWVPPWDQVRCCEAPAAIPTRILKPALSAARLPDRARSCLALFSYWAYAAGVGRRKRC
jgi:hypothetical protein